MDSISQEMVQRTPSVPTCCQRTREERGAAAPSFHSPFSLDFYLQFFPFLFDPRSISSVIISEASSGYRCLLHLFEKPYVLNEKWTRMGRARETQSKSLKMPWVLLLNHHPFPFSHCFLSSFETLDTRGVGVGWGMAIFGLRAGKPQRKKNYHTNHILHSQRRGQELQNSTCKIYLAQTRVERGGEWQE